MFELKVEQENSRGYGEEIVLYFNNEEFEKMCLLMQMLMKASRDEITFLVREIEEGQVEDDEN